jgi:hypothetical protein
VSPGASTRNVAMVRGSTSRSWPSWTFLFVYVVPLLVANAIVMSYIATNHFLNPLTVGNT